MKYHYFAILESNDLCGVNECISFDSDVCPDGLTEQQIEEMFIMQPWFDDVEDELRSVVYQQMVEDEPDYDEGDIGFSITSIEITPIVERNVNFVTEGK